MRARASLEECASQVRKLIRLATRDCTKTHDEAVPETDKDGLAAGTVSEEEFGALAGDLFRLQFEHNAAYRKFCESRNAVPRSVRHWSEIPAVPTAAFRELELTSLPVEERTTVFHSSGTSGQSPSRHFHGSRSLALYEAALWPWFKAHLLPERGSKGWQLALLTPRPSEAPHSSLTYMFDTVRRRLELPESSYYGEVENGGHWNLELQRVAGALAALAQGERPVLVLGTAFLFVHLLDWLAERDWPLALPPGSRVLETGGYKGRSRTLSKRELHDFISRQLGIPHAQIMCEYGMSELSSQAYDYRIPGLAPSGLRAFRFPPWVRVQIVSPETGREAAEGETGLIRVFDLANVYSVMGIQTEDLGFRCGKDFALMGRADLSEPRGCSLMALRNRGMD